MIFRYLLRALGGSCKPQQYFRKELTDKFEKVVTHSKIVMEKKTNYFQLTSREEREKKIDELKVLEQELGSLKKNAKLYQSHGNSNLFFIADRDKVHSETKLSITKLTETHMKLQ